MSKQVCIGIIGAGVISGIYLQNLTTRWPHVQVLGIADLVEEKSQARAQEYGVPALSIDELLQHPDISIVVNLTIPAVHAAVSQQIIAAGKSVHTEKPLATSLADGTAVLQAAEKADVRVGCAPDTFLGAGLQTVRRAIDDGLIGTPIAFNARMITHGMEDWHPDPFFFYQPGAGPMLDMGPYYLTALTTILGPVAGISSRTSMGFAERVITSEPKSGEKVPVNTPTHIESVLELESGVNGTLTTSFDLYDPEHSWFVIYGTEGTIKLPDPNTFGGPVQLLDIASKEWQPLDLGDDRYAEDSRGIAVADMASAMLEDRPHRASGALGYHVLEVMLGALQSGESHETVRITSTVDRPAPLGAEV